MLKLICLSSSVIANIALLYFYLSVEPSKENTTDSIQSKMNILHLKNTHKFNNIPDDVKYAELLIENERLRQELLLRKNSSKISNNELEYHVYSILKVRAISMYFMENTNYPSAIEIAVKIIVDCNDKLKAYNIDPYDSRLYVDIKDLYKLELDVIPRIINEPR